MMTENGRFSEQRLKGRCAIVTGGGSGIGREYAHRLGAEGARVVVSDIDVKAGEAVADELTEFGAVALAIAADVGDEQQVSAMVQAAIGSFGKVDVLVNNAARFFKLPVFQGEIEDLPVEEFAEVMRVNVLGSWLCSREVVPSMKEHGYGKIVNVSSGTVFKGSGGDMLHYVASKSAILGLTRSMARSVGRFGIRVNCIAPGFTVTEAFSSEQVEAARSRASTERALARVETPADLAGVVAFLCSAESDFMTGQTVVVDGGAYMH